MNDAIVSNMPLEIPSNSQIRKICRQYESVASTTVDCFTLIDANYIYREANESYCRSHGKSREEIVGRNVEELWGPEVFRAVIEQPLKQCLAGREVHYQARFEFPKTGVRYFDVSFFPYDRAGSVRHAIVVTRDITASRRAEEEVGLLLTLTRSVHESKDFDSALQVSLRTICEATDWAFGQAWIPSVDGGSLQCGPAWYRPIAGLEDLRSRALGTSWRQGEGLPGRVWSSRKPLWVTEAAEFPPGLRKVGGGVKAATAIPVIANDVVVAVMEFCVLDPQHEDERLVGAVSAVATQLGTVFVRKRSEEALRRSEEHHRELFQQAYRMQEDLRHLSKQILEVQEEERTRISRELHDEVGQALTAISVNLAVMKKEISRENGRAGKRLEDSQALLARTMQTVHDFASGLRPAMLDDLGLVAALRTFIKDFVERTGIKVRLRVSAVKVVETLEIGRKTVIYRIAQESLNNVAKHAHATEVRFVIGRHGSSVWVEIKDNGQGFGRDLRPESREPKRLGLLGMQERVRLVHGEFTIDAKPGHGTLIRVRIPLKGDPRPQGTSLEQDAPELPFASAVVSV